LAIGSWLNGNGDGNGDGNGYGNGDGNGDGGVLFITKDWLTVRYV